MNIEPVVWDTEFFGYPVGRLFLDSEFDSMRLNSLLVAAPYNVVQIMIEDPAESDLDAMKSIADQIDLKRDYGKMVTPSEEPLPGVSCYTGELTAELLELVLLSGHDSRFRLDPVFARDFPRLYEEWISGSLSGRLADAVFVSEQDEHLNGFLTLSGGARARVGLVAVTPEFHGRGIGGALLAAANRWCFQNGCSELRIATQGHNAAACRLYEKSGFRVVSETAIYHYWTTLPEAS